MRSSSLNRSFAVFLVFLVPVLLTAAGGPASAEPGKALRVIMIGAHPDDVEAKGGGTAALWAKAGVEVLLVAVTNGDAGHQSEGGGALARRRAAESRRSAEILGVSWKTLGFHDGELVPSLEARNVVMKAVREWQADVVISHRPNDYHPDHRYTGQLVQDVAYMVAVPNLVPDTPRLTTNPIFMYFSDRFQKPYPFIPNVAVDVDPVMDLKWRSLDAMDSQMYEWLPWVDGHLDEVPEGKDARYQWLIKWRSPGMLREADKARDVLVKRYGKARADKIKFAETFELCEYGRQPTEKELFEIFPK